MIEILKEAELIKKKQGGKSNKLTMEDRLLMTLEYLREYRTYFHVANNYGIRENTCYRNVKWIEDVLIKSKEVSLPNQKKALLKNGRQSQFLVVTDVGVYQIYRTNIPSYITSNTIEA
jgi:hypothetical protein